MFAIVVQDKIPTSPKSPEATKKGKRGGRGKKGAKANEENSPMTPQQSPRPPRSDLIFSCKKTPADISPGRFSNPGSNIKLMLDDEPTEAEAMLPGSLQECCPLEV